MVKLGTNVKLSILAQYRPKVHGLFVEILGAKAVQPKPELEAYILNDGASIGVFYVDAKEALSVQDQVKGAWLEFLVDDPAAVGKRLDSAGVARKEYEDKSHAYFQIPGGPIFRLAAPKA